MKSKKGLLVALVLLTSFPILAQQAGVSAGTQQSASASAAGASANESSSASANASATAPQMHPVSGELVGKLDSKTAKVGDEVVVKTTATAHTAGGMVIPKGSRLVGHVTDVHSHAKGGEDGVLAVQFDRAELKGGQTLGIQSVIESISPSASAMAMASTESDDSLGLSGGGGHSAGGGRIGGGALSTGSSLAGGASGALGTTAAATGSGLTSAGNGTLGAAGNLSGTSSNAGSLQAAASGATALGAHATAVPGVMLAGDATGSTSGTLSASRKNVHLDSGTQIILGVAAAANR